MEWEHESTTSLLWVHGKRMPSSFRIFPDADHLKLLQRVQGRASFGSLSYVRFIIEEFTPPTSSAIIQDVMALRDAGLASVAYFYFDFRDIDKQNLHNLLPSLLTQLSARSDRRCEILSRVYKAHDDGAHKPSTSTMVACLKEMLALPGQDPIYIILDALDECPNTTGIPSARKQVLDLLKDIVDLRLSDLHLCVTSRPEIDIRTALEPLAFHPVSLHDQSGQKKDIEDYIRSVVYEDSDTTMRRWRDKDKELVIETLTERADGM
jgi:hypothetical protein